MNSRKRFSNALKIALGLAITVLALYFFFKSVSLHEVLGHLKRLNALTVLAVIGLTLLSLYLRGLRMKYLLPRQEGASDKGMMAVVTVAFMANNVLPARIGEAVRVFLLYKKNRYSLHSSLGVVAVERVIDSTGYALCVLIPAAFYLPLFRTRQFMGAVPVMYLVKFTFVAACCAILAGLLYRLFPGRFLGLFSALSDRLWRPVGRALGHLVTLLRESTEWMFNLQRTAIVLALTPLVLGSYVSMMFILARALDVDLRPLQALFSAGVVAFGVALPSSPGYVGTLHLALRESFLVFGFTASAGAAVAILYHLISWAVTVVAGIFFYFRMDVRFSQMKIPESGREGQK
ncbi:MAG: lysylphosphatidylglycerol synthase transmembrane domain-containing protein [Fibrobacterota bacterium]